MPLFNPPGSGSGAPTDADYLVGTANGSLSAEIAVGTSPGGELGGTWASPTVDATHSGSTHTTPLYDAKGDILAASAADTPAKVTVGANATQLRADSAASAGVAWVVHSAVLQATGDVATSLNTLANVTGFTFATVAGATYYFRAYLSRWANATTVGWLATMNHSTAVTSIRWVRRYQTSATAFVYESLAALQAGTVPTSSGGTVPGLEELEGTVVINTAGTLALQHRSETATETRVNAGSTLFIYRIS